MMHKYGQAEYAYGILRQSSAQLWRRDFVGFGDTIFQEKVVLCM